MSRIAIVGVGRVGGAVAYALMLGSMAKELLLIDIDVELREAQLRDLADVGYSCNSRTRVRGASYRDAAQCDIIVFTAETMVTRGQTTLDFTYRNISILREVLDATITFKPDAILLIACSPVDLLTTLAQRLSKLPASQVIGTGTFLDSVRLRGMISDQIGVAAKSIDIHVLGVQGESQTVAWSAATIGGMPIDKCISPEVLKRNELERESTEHSLGVARARGTFPMGIGLVVASLCSSILLDKRNIRPVSHWQPDTGCCFSTPVIIGRKGVVGTILFPLSEAEGLEVRQAVEGLKITVNRVDGIN
ncbi:L-lactate dehydrogenase A [Apiospora arundinis]|uniref:L-lactate dehydrogenase A n=1 Tax=Apiospora arundinis TaxID=335852 RepID=A0ABR2IXA8_9PEZI